MNQPGWTAPTGPQPYDGMPYAVGMNAGLYDADQAMGTKNQFLTVVGVLMIVHGVIGLPAVAIQAVYILSAQGQAQVQEAIEQQAAEGGIPIDQVQAIFIFVMVAIGIAASVAAILTLMGGIQVVRRRMWTYAMISAVACLVPCHCCLAILNVPLAITAMIMIASRKREFS